MRPRLIQLLVAGGGDGHLRPVQLGDLQGEDGDSTGAEGQNEVPRFHATQLHHRIPRRDARGRERRRLLVAEGVRDFHQGGGGDDDLLRQPAVQGDAEIGAEDRGGEGAGEPGDEVGAGGAVADLHVAHALAHGDDHAHAVGAGGAVLRLARAVFAGKDFQVAVVQADGGDLQQRLAVAADGRGFVDEGQRGEALLVADLVGFHGFSPIFCQKRGLVRGDHLDKRCAYPAPAHPREGGDPDGLG